MNIPLWVYRIWNERNGGDEQLNTYRKERGKLETLIEQTQERLPEATWQDAERVVCYAWALYVFRDPPLYNDETKFPLSSFIEVAEGYVVSAADGIAANRLEHGRASLLKHGRAYGAEEAVVKFGP